MRNFKGENNPNWKQKIKKVCPICDTKFEVPPSLNRIKFCSTKCAGKAKQGIPSKRKNGITKKCLSCGKDFYVPKYRILKALFCSNKCINIQRKPWNYIHGLGKEKRRYGVYWEPIRKKVIERDKNICKQCGSYGNDIDHIIPFRISKDNSLENLQVLCKNCHTIKSNWEVKYYG